MKEVDRLGDVGSLVDDDEAFPGLDMHFEQVRPHGAVLRDWRRDAAFQYRINAHLLADDHIT